MLGAGEVGEKLRKIWGREDGGGQGGEGRANGILLDWRAN